MSRGWPGRAAALVVGAALSLSSIARAQAPRDAKTVEAVEAHRRLKAATTRAERELSQYRLAIALYRLRFYQPAFGLFSEIADHPDHLRFEETLAWLARLATDLPEPADVIEAVGRYDSAAIDRVATSQRELGWQLDYLLGRYKYRNRHYDDAIRLFAKVDRSSRYYEKAQFFSGIANVQMRRPFLALQSFERIVRAVDDGRREEGGDDDERMRDLALLSMARTYYSTSTRLDRNGAVTASGERLAAAVKSWEAVDVASEYSGDALFERSWAQFLMGDHARALGNLHALQDWVAVLGGGDIHPEYDILKSTIYLSNCRYDDAATISARVHARYLPVATDFANVLVAFRGEDRDELLYRFLRDVRDGKANVPARSKTSVENALSDRALLRHVQYIQVLDDERKRLETEVPSFRDAPLGADVRDAIQLARDIAVRNAGQLARARLQRSLDELGAQLRLDAEIFAAALAAKRGATDRLALHPRVPRRDAERNVVRADEEHVLWPFDGEYWPDEVGRYQQSIRSSCR
jgi:tetratricopeptide (TPR) repeat protein